MNTNTTSASYVNTARLTSLTDAARTIAADLESAVDRLARALAVEIASHESGACKRHRLPGTSLSGWTASTPGSCRSRSTVGRGCRSSSRLPTTTTSATCTRPVTSWP